MILARPTVPAGLPTTAHFVELYPALFTRALGPQGQLRIHPITDAVFTACILMRGTP